jgi:NAD(P)-dependent dehydrogenase (short-subunit alcohol dehydrogenase family)
LSGGILGWLAANWGPTPISCRGRIGDVTRTMLIAGASGGIGSAVARAAAESGYRVMVAGRLILADFIRQPSDGSAIGRSRPVDGIFGTHKVRHLHSRQAHGGRRLAPALPTPEELAEIEQALA